MEKENKLTLILNYVKYHLIDDIRYLPNNISTGISNIIKYFKIVWNDRDYDYTYIFNILRFKLEKQAKYINDKNRFISSRRNAELMLLTSRLIELIKVDAYDTEYMDYYESKIEFVPYGDKKDLFSMEETMIYENFDEYFKKYPLQYKKALNGELNRFTREEDESKNKKIYAMEIAQENHNRCRRLLFKILESNIEKWWD
jgi:hypothetical protein